MTTSSGPGAETASAEPRDEAEANSLSQAYGPAGAPRGPGWYEENGRRWTILAGYSVEEATRRATAAGFVGHIDVAQVGEHQADCKVGTVCFVTPKRWELGMDRELTLWVNRALTISTPD